MVRRSADAAQHQTSATSGTPRTSMRPSEQAEAMAFILRISLVAARPEAVCSTTTCPGQETREFNQSMPLTAL